MKVKVKVLGAGEEHVEVDRKPDVCPLCHHSIEPTRHVVCTASGPTDARETMLEQVYQCTRHACSHLFVGRYRRTTSQGERFVGEFKLKEVVPQELKPIEINQEVESISQSFKLVFLQAAAAEAHGLNEIAGLGYRKALEFLVKDFCIHNDPDKEQKIKAELLGNTIANRIDDPNVKECARRAAWLGNDEAHYVRRWEDRDITDLKVLIELTSNWITNCVLTEKYLKEMNPK